MGSDNGLVTTWSNSSQFLHWHEQVINAFDLSSVTALVFGSLNVISAAIDKKRWLWRTSRIWMTIKLTMKDGYREINPTLQWRQKSQITGVRIVYSTLLFCRRSKKTPKLPVTGLCEGNSPVTGEFPTQRASNAENVPIWWSHHEETPSDDMPQRKTIPTCCVLPTSMWKMDSFARTTTTSCSACRKWWGCWKGEHRHITMTSWWARWRFKSPVSRLFTQPFIQTQVKENIKALRHWPLWVEFTGDQWIPRT